MVQVGMCSPRRAAENGGDMMDSNSIMPVAHEGWWPVAMSCALAPGYMSRYCDMDVLWADWYYYSLV
jgi:hypothetical protein